MDAGVGIDTAIHKDAWKDTSIICEIVCFDFKEARQRATDEAMRIASLPVPKASLHHVEQLAFFQGVARCSAEVWKYTMFIPVLEAHLRLKS
ncbi:hypothetical protein GGQ73_004449 [Rhizobium skierniewicense]|uniref:Uncharacterized protein n=1 Tax=Rhizobium skierniewicense TaxID=984260 RepID=A0A7W6CA36_9HYPH|nr:hypothetical protein [Rhizobium skierniewicense]MBB3948462.1 hypothetical protein [Rhizobium skierniewicense]